MSFLKTCIFLALVAWGTIICQAGELLVKSNDKIAFLGDSITRDGAGPGGYAMLVIRGLEANGIRVEPIYAGKGGNTSNEMLVRIDTDVLSKNPTIMTLSCGVNDVGHGEKGVPLDKYRENITAIIDKVQAAGVKPVIFTSTMLTEDPVDKLNQTLASYNDFLRTLAQKRKLPLADLNSQMQAALKRAKETKRSKAEQGELPHQRWLPHGSAGQSDDG